MFSFTALVKTSAVKEFHQTSCNMSSLKDHLTREVQEGDAHDSSVRSTLGCENTPSQQENKEIFVQTQETHIIKTSPSMGMFLR